MNTIRPLFIALVLAAITIGSSFVVSSKFSPPQKTVTVGDTRIVIEPICTGKDAQNFDCFETHYNTLTLDNSIAAAFVDLKARYDTDAYVASQCHPLTHVIGRATAKNANDVSEAYTQGDSFCWSGFYHGVLEGIVGRLGRKAVLSDLDAICKNIPGRERYVFDYYNCVHGLGHGLMAITGDELFESLDYCKKMTGAWEQLSCASGVYMENVIIDGKNHSTKYLTPKDPVYPCNKSPEQFKNTCYLMQTSYMLKVYGNDYAKVFKVCAGVEANYRATCYQSLGRDVSGQSISNVATTKTNCNLGKDLEQRSNCIIGAVKDFISYHHSDVQANELCNSLDADLTDICAVTAKEYYKSFK